MMICTVDCRTHQVCCTRIYTNIFFICMFLMNCLCNQTTIRSHHKTSHLCINRHIPKTSRNQYFFKYFFNTCTDDAYIVRCLIRFVRNANTTGKIYKADADAKFLFDLNDQFKQCSCQCRIIIICYRVTYQKRMQTKFLHAFVTENAICLK